MDLYADDTTLYDIGLGKDILENNLQHSLNLLKIWYLEHGMIINIDKIKLMLISSMQKRKCMKHNKLAFVYDNFDLQLTSCEKELGVHIDDNFTWTTQFKHVSKKDIVIPLTFVSDENIPFFTTQSYFATLILSLILNIVVWFGGIHLILLYIKLKSYRKETANWYLGTDYISFEDARRQLNMFSFDEL